MKSIVAKTARRITSAAVTAIALLLVSALPALAEQASAESADFTVSTVPEPATLLVGLCVLLLARRKCGVSWQRAIVGQKQENV